MLAVRSFELFRLLVSYTPLARARRAVARFAARRRAHSSSQARRYPCTARATLQRAIAIAKGRRPQPLFFEFRADFPEHFTEIRLWSKSISVHDVHWDGDLICSTAQTIDGIPLTPEAGTTPYETLVVHKELFTGLG